MMNVSAEQLEIDRLYAIGEQIFAYLGLIILILGTVGNSLNLIVFARLDSLKTLASSLFLLVSSIASQTVLTIGLSTRVIRGFSGTDPVHTSVMFCKIRWTIRTIANATSLTCVCLAALDRYLFSCHNVRRHGWITMKRARLAILISILFWTGVFSSYGVYYAAPKPNSCLIADPVFAYVASYFNLLHYSLLPLTILTTFCFLTWRNLGQQPTTFLRGGTRLYDQVTRMLVAQTGGILITSTPNMIWQIYSVSTKTVQKNPMRQSRENLFNTLCVLVGFSTHAVTFYTYYIGSPTFRKNIHDTVCKGRRIAPAQVIERSKVDMSQSELHSAITIQKY